MQKRSQQDVWQKMQEVVRSSSCFILRLLGVGDQVCFYALNTIARANTKVFISSHKETTVMS